MVDAASTALSVRTPEFESFLFGVRRPAAVGMDGVQLERCSLGRVDIPDGRVYACDPLAPMDTRPLAQRLSPGQYEVVLFVLVGTEHGAADAKTERNVAVAVICSGETAVSWELASREGGPSDAAAYGVDSGTGGFMGSRAIEQLVEGEVLGLAVKGALDGTLGAVVSIADGVSVAAVHSGMGDGTYDTWLGRDAQGQAAVILTDFDVLKSEEYVSRVHAEWAARKARKWWQLWR
jgi:Protein of unknown function (DUF4241)